MPVSAFVRPGGPVAVFDYMFGEAYDRRIGVGRKSGQVVEVLYGRYGDTPTEDRRTTSWGMKKAMANSTMQVLGFKEETIFSRRTLRGPPKRVKL